MGNKNKNKNKNYSLRTVPTIIEHAMEVGVRRKAVMGMRPWGYMHAGAMEVEVLKGTVMGMRPWGYMQEEVRRRKEGGGEGEGGGTFI